MHIKHAAEEDVEPEDFDDAEEDLVPRPPVVTIMGHVDHGKTTLLDAIRKTAVVETEAGGITQHIGAYQVQHDGREITFLDTPGHEAFTAMRARGAKVTDIAVLVVAADDGVMPQTKESIAHARAAEVPIVVAVNKIDAPEADPNRVRRSSPPRGFSPRSGAGRRSSPTSPPSSRPTWTICSRRCSWSPTSSRRPQGQPGRRGVRPIIESRLDVGRGPVATMLVHRGTLNVGDAIVAGDAWGKVRALHDFRGEKVQSAGPGDPIEILGFDHPPPAGELGRVVENERAGAPPRPAARPAPAHRAARPVREAGPVARAHVRRRRAQDLNLVVKGDVVGSVEAALSELQKIQHAEVRVTVIHSGVGGITENDVMLASASQALVVGFNVRPNAEARALAEREGVEIRTYRVIYRLTEDIEQALVGMLKPVEREDTIGEAEVRQLFRVSRLGTIAGCYVTQGRVRRNAQVRVLRDGAVVSDTSIAQLKRFKDDVREVEEGFECGILLENFNDVKEGDVLEFYETRQIERTDLSDAAS